MRMTSCDKLRQWLTTQKLRGKLYIKTSQIFAWGVKFHSNRAARNARSFAERGQYLRRLTAEQKYNLGFQNQKEGIYEII